MGLQLQTWEMSQIWRNHVIDRWCSFIGHVKWKLNNRKLEQWKGLKKARNKWLVFPAFFLTAQVPWLNKFCKMMMVGRRGAALRNGAPRGGHDDRTSRKWHFLFVSFFSMQLYREKRVLEGDSSAIHYPKIGSRVEHRYIACSRLCNAFAISCTT